MLKYMYCAMAGYTALILAVGALKRKSLQEQLTACLVMIPLLMRALLIR